MEEQYKKIQNLEIEIDTLQNSLYEKKTKLEIEKKLLKNICTHPNFIKEDNCDYHKPGYYYTCSTCGFWYK
jgi:hypothetical protein